MRKIKKGQSGLITPQLSFQNNSIFGMNNLLNSFNNNTNIPVQNMALSAGLASFNSPNLQTAITGQNLVNNTANQLSQGLENPIDKLGFSSISPVQGDMRFIDKFNNSAIGKNAGLLNAGINMVNSVLTGVLGPKSEYSGDRGNITQTMDDVYDDIQSAAGAIPVYGQLIQLGMGINKGLGTVANKLGAGTDGMTTADAILGSSFLQMTPFGLINGAFGKHANTIVKDQEAFAQVGSSYGGTNSLVDDALSKSGKKYGLFSRRGLNDANNLIADANLQQTKIGNIADEAKLGFDTQQVMNDYFTNRNLFNTSGGWDYRAVHYGKLGLKFSPAESNRILHKTKPTEILLVDYEPIEEFKEGGVIEQNYSEIQLVPIEEEIEEFKDGGKTPEFTFEQWYKTIPEDRNDTTSYNLRRAFELAPKEELEAWRTSSIDDLKNGKNHLRSVYLNPDTGIYEFMKSKNHPTLRYELEWYNSDDPKAIQFRQDYDLDTSEEYYKYIPKNPGIYEKGGSINVIPDGALHARKHNMDMDGITKKGIPVISNNGEQQAEIELNEIIFRLEVTKKLEELQKIFYNEESSNKEKEDAALEAGKLLTQEILYNTQDNTGLLEQIN